MALTLEHDHPSAAPEARPAASAMLSDEQLAAEIQAGAGSGPSGALAVLVGRHHSPLLGFLYRLTGGDRPLAEDLVQETFLRAWRRLGQYQPGRPFKPWLYAIAVNAGRDHFKSADARRTASMEPAFDAPGASSPLQALLEAERWQQVTQAVRALPIQQREVLLLRYVEDMPLQEIAEVAGIPLGTVKSRLSLALARLRAHLAAGEGDQGDA